MFVDLGKAFSSRFMRRSADRSSSPLPFGEGTTSNCPREKTMTTTTTTIKKLPTHELFDVQQREGQKAFWNRVGAAFENRDGSHSVLLYQPGLPEPKRLQLRRIDREKRPLNDGADPKKFPTHELFIVVEAEGGPNEWKRVGVGFTNKDDSLSLIVDDGVRDGPKARFQMRLRRDAPPRADDAPAADSAPAKSAPAATTARTVVRKRDVAA
ncbi:MAG: hypothetical protein IT383_19505 [Deltaproteobacteria bacterium]|nr:hypothetical protein [Deltaproteobacteria bacterium]